MTKAQTRKLKQQSKFHKKKGMEELASSLSHLQGFARTCCGLAAKEKLWKLLPLPVEADGEVEEEFEVDVEMEVTPLHVLNPVATSCRLFPK